ncbi:MAG: hypothetical protein M1831_000861 [Alyxoria varia]|nr:MAG: hypothetical protein M1831_000861 [Alyxoria varia]
MSSNSSNCGQRDQPPAYNAPTNSARPQYIEYADKPRKYQSRASIVMESFKASRSNSIDRRASSATNGADATSTHSKTGLLSKLKGKFSDRKGKKTETPPVEEGRKERSYEPASHYMSIR